MSNDTRARLEMAIEEYGIACKTEGEMETHYGKEAMRLSAEACWEDIMRLLTRLQEEHEEEEVLFV